MSLMCLTSAKFSPVQYTTCIMLHILYIPLLIHLHIYRIWCRNYAWHLKYKRIFYCMFWKEWSQKTIFLNISFILLNFHKIIISYSFAVNVVAFVRTLLTLFLFYFSTVLLILRFIIIWIPSIPMLNYLCIYKERI